MDHDTGCVGRTVADVAAVADPTTGVAVYDSTPHNNQSGWLVAGGTSVAAPLVAATYALSGAPAPDSTPASFLYATPTGLSDVTTGSNGSCGTYLCTATAGYDGPTGLGTPRGTSAFTAATTPPVNTIPTPVPPSVAVTFTRIAGVDRYGTSAQTAAKFGSASTVILASGEVGHSVDALSAAYLAGVNSAPILLTRNGFTPPEVLAQILASGARNIVIIGGGGVVGDPQLTALQGAGYTVTRLGGPDRYTTAAQVIAAAGKPAGTTALLASGTVFADALGAGPLSYAKGLPLAITDPTVLPAATLTALQNAGITHVLILGGAAAISQNVRNQLTAAGITVAAPFAGQDRSQTSTLLAQYEIAHYGFTTTAVNVASGSTTADGADALGGAALSGKQLRPLLITNNTNDPGSITTYLSTITATLTTGTLFGGVSAIS